MDEPLSYASLKCVLEYLEANKRMHITSRHPTLKIIEKAIPLHIDSLCFENFIIHLNGITYRFYTSNKRINSSDDENQRLEAGDIAFGGYWYFDYEGISFQNAESKEFCTDIPINLKLHLSYKRLTSFFFENRKEITVNNLKFNVSDYTIVRLPKNLKVKIRKLQCKDQYFDYILPIIHESSYPLEELFTFVKTGDNRQHPVFKSAKKLTIRAYYDQEELVLNIIRESLNHYLILKHVYIGEEGLTNFIQQLVDNTRDIGTIWEIGCHLKVAKWIKHIKERFNGRSVQLNGEPDERYIPNSECISIPLNSTSELYIYGIAEKEYNTLYESLKMEVVPIGSLNYWSADYVPFLFLNIGILLSFYFLKN